MKSIRADCVIALSFGIASHKTTKDPNKEIAIAASSVGLPIITQQEVATYCQDTLTVIKAEKEYLDTYKVLSRAKTVMESNRFSKAVLIAHNAHIKRGGKQATLLDIDYIILSGLPNAWDRFSQQWWTRSRLLWRIHELFTVPYLKLFKRL